MEIIHHSFFIIYTCIFPILICHNGRPESSHHKWTALSTQVNSPKCNSSHESVIFFLFLLESGGLSSRTCSPSRGMWKHVNVWADWLRAVHLWPDQPGCTLILTGSKSSVNHAHWIICPVTLKLSQYELYQRKDVVTMQCSTGRPWVRTLTWFLHFGTHHPPKHRCRCRLRADTPSWQQRSPMAAPSTWPPVWWIWWLGWCLELFLMVLGPFLSCLCSVAGRIVCEGRPLPSGRRWHCHECLVCIRV